MIRNKITDSAPITGINPFNELPIDASIWREAHDHHHQHRHLHAMASHRPGIVYGLEVFSSTTQDRTLIVAPGIAVDPAGRTIVLREALQMTLDEKGQLYITLSYKQPSVSQSAVTIGGGVKYYQYLEGREVLCTKELPNSEYVELARIYRTGTDKQIKDASNPLDPTSDEINLLHRQLAFPHCYVDTSVGELAYVPKPASGSAQVSWKPNRMGLWNLIQEGSGKGFHLSFAGVVDVAPGKTSNLPSLLYMAGEHKFQPLASEQVEGIRRFLDEGGMLVGESCGSKEFGTAFQELAGQLGANLKKVDHNHPLLRAHYIFPAAPEGAASGDVYIDDKSGVVFSERNYGGAWQGEVPKRDDPNARERVRQAIEFGLNLVVYAANRHRGQQLRKLF